MSGSVVVLLVVDVGQWHHVEYRSHSTNAFRRNITEEDRGARRIFLQGGATYGS